MIFITALFFAKKVPDAASHTDENAPTDFESVGELLFIGKIS